MTRSAKLSENSFYVAGLAKHFSSSGSPDKATEF